MEKRYILFISLSFLIFILTQIYVQKTTPQRPPATQPAPTVGAPGTTPGAAPTAATPATPPRTDAPTPTPVPRAEAPTVEFATKVYTIKFSTQGAVPISWDIIDPRFVIPAAGESKTETQREQPRERLIEPAINQYEEIPRPYETVLQELNADFYNFNHTLFTSEPVAEGKLRGFRFTSQPIKAGVRMIKTYLFDPEGYTSRLRIELVNESKTNLTFDGGQSGLGIILGPGLGERPTENAPGYQYATVEALVMGPSNIEYKKLTDQGQAELFPTTAIAWGGIQNKYFMNALIADAANPLVVAKAFVDPDSLSLVTKPKDLHFFPTLELYGKPFKIDAGQSVAFNYEVFAGPKQREILKAADHNLSRVLFYSSWGWMRALCLGLMTLLTFFHKVLASLGVAGAWGVSIILLTIVVRLLAFPLVTKGMKAQAKMMAEQQRLKPLMDKINEKYKNDPQRRQQEIMKMYREHGVNPFGMFKGCLWLLIQMPIFFALYLLLNQSIDLRGAHFLWIEDLAAADRLFSWSFSIPFIGNHFNLLPILMAVTQMLTSKFSPQSPNSDPQQAQMQKMMIYFMPVFMLFILYGMASGLVLYWLISNIWQILQQLWINKHMPPPKPPAVPPAPARAKA